MERLDPSVGALGRQEGSHFHDTFFFLDPSVTRWNDRRRGAGMTRREYWDDKRRGYLDDIIGVRMDCKSRSLFRSFAQDYSTKKLLCLLNKSNYNDNSELKLCRKKSLLSIN